MCVYARQMDVSIKFDTSFVFRVRTKGQVFAKKKGGK